MQYHLRIPMTELLWIFNLTLAYQKANLERTYIQTIIRDSRNPHWYPRNSWWWKARVLPVLNKVPCYEHAWRVAVYIPALLTSALDGGQRSTSCPGRFTSVPSKQEAGLTLEPLDVESCIHISYFFLWHYSPNLGLGLPPWNFPFHFGFLDLRQLVGLLGRVISSSQGLYLYINTEKTHTHT
jgi:hypothetical protein